MPEAFSVIWEISTHAPRTGSDADLCCGFIRHAISTHAPRTGSDGKDRKMTDARLISTHAPRTGSDDSFRHAGVWYIPISTHAPRTGSDPAALRPHSLPPPISTHAPRTGSDRTATHKRRRERFQPTLPARGATTTTGRDNHDHTDFNPRSPHGERHHLSIKLSDTAKISTHAPRTGSDARR